MVSFVDKLLLSRQLKFEEGRLSIFDQRVVIIPVELLLLIIKKSSSDSDFEDTVYNAMKDSVYQFSESLAERRGVKREEMANILIKLAEVNGYGKL